MLLENLAGVGLLTPALDNNARAAHNLAGLALVVDLAKASELTQFLSILNLKLPFRHRRTNANVSMELTLRRGMWYSEQRAVISLT